MQQRARKILPRRTHAEDQEALVNFKSDCLALHSIVSMLAAIPETQIA